MDFDNIEKREYKKKKSYGFLRMFFSRGFFIVGIIFLEIALLFAFLKFLDYKTIGAIAVFARIVGIIITFNSKNLKNAYRLTWLMLVAISPVFAISFYLFLYTSFNNMKTFKMLKKRISQSDNIIENTSNEFNLSKENKNENGLLHYFENYCQSFAYTNNDTKYFSCGEEYFKSLFTDLENAKKFIFIEYFIISNGVILDELMRILKKKSEEGVEIKFMYDGLSSIRTVPLYFDKTLSDFGIECKKFKPLTPFIDSYHNNRDHRKIAVIDGKVAYTGGVNIADEYANIISKYGKWKDAGIRISGNAVNAFTIYFLQVWYMTEDNENVEYEKYISENSSNIKQEDVESYIAPYTDYPKLDENIANQLYQYIIQHAHKYVYVMTPYLILEESMVDSIGNALKEGVDVRIIVPHIPDKPYAFALTKSYCRELIDMGAKIYEYKPGFIHSKVVLSDDKRAVVGTSNFDYRSLFLHYECGVYLYKNKIQDDIKKDFERTFEESIEITKENVNQYNTKLEKIAGILLKPIAPLM